MQPLHKGRKLRYDNDNYMEIATKKFGRFLLALGLVAFLSAAFFGASQTMGMEQRNDGTMGGCLFTGVEEICSMTFSEHLAEWQSMFTSIPSLHDALTIPLALLASLALGFLLTHRAIPPPSLDPQPQFIRHRTRIPIVNHLQELFSSGILHPRLYN